MLFLNNCNNIKIVVKLKKHIIYMSLCAFLRYILGDILYNTFFKDKVYFT